MSQGIAPSDLPSASLLDAVIGYVQLASGVADVRRMDVAALVLQLAGELVVASLAAPAYPTTSAGVAAVGEGDWFSVPAGSAGGGIRIYRVESGVAVEKASLAGTGDLTAFTAEEKAKLAAISPGAQVNAVTSVAGRTGSVILTAADVGLDAVTNTADADKPVSSPQAAAIAAAVASIAALPLPWEPWRAESWRHWSATVTGEPEARAPIDAGLIQDTADGRALVLTSPGRYGPRVAVRAEPGRLYRLSAVVRRVVNPADPANAAVLVGVLPLNAAKAPLASTPITVQSTTLTTASGRTILECWIGGDGQDGAVQWPAGTVYLAPFIECFDVSHTTAWESVRLDDLTAWYLAGVRLDALSAALDAETAERVALAARVTAAEADIDALGVGLTDEVAARAEVAARLAAEIAEREALIRTAGGPVLYLATPTGEVVGTLSSAGRLELLPGGEYATSDGLSMTAARLALLGAVLSGDGLDLAGFAVRPSAVGGLLVCDRDGGVLFRVRPEAVDLPGLSTSWTDTRGLTLADSGGGFVGHFDTNGTRLPFGELVARTDFRGVVIADLWGGVHFWTGQPIAEVAEPEPDPEPVAPDVSPYLSQTLAGWADEPPLLYVRQMLADRDAAALATLQRAGTAISVTGSETLAVPLPAAGTAGSGMLTLRAAGFPAVSWRRRPVDLVSVPPAPGGSPTVSILVNGDSIAHGQGSAILAAALTEKGITPTMRGTMTSGGLPSGSGPLGEARSGMELREIAYTKVDRLSPVAIGDEAAYLAMAAGDQRYKNPYIRAATGGDAAEDITSGYILDFPVYGERFSVLQPDIFVHQYGTNDTRDADPATFEEIYAADMLIYRRLRLGWPGTRILRTLPSPARLGEADAEIWALHYTTLIRAMMAAVRDSNLLLSAGSKIILHPGWAIQPAEAGFSLTVTATNSDTGVQTATMDDPVHPLDTSRRALWRSVAAYAAAMTLGLI